MGGGAGHAVVPACGTTGGAAGNGAEATADALVLDGLHGLALETQGTSMVRVVDARSEAVAGGAPDGARHGHALVEDAHGGSEERVAIDEVGGAIDRVDGPEVLGIGKGMVVLLLAEDGVVGKALGEALADHLLDGAVDLGDGSVGAASSDLPSVL